MFKDQKEIYAYNERTNRGFQQLSTNYKKVDIIKVNK